MNPIIEEKLKLLNQFCKDNRITLSADHDWDGSYYILLQVYDEENYFVCGEEIIEEIGTPGKPIKIKWQ